MESITIEQEIKELIEDLKSQEGQTLVQLLNATAPQLQAIHEDLQTLNSSLATTLARL